MHYLLLVYRSASPGHHSEQFEQACRSYTEWLRQHEHSVTALTLTGETSITLHKRRGQLELQAGRYLAADDALREVYLIQARDLNHALYLAAQMPQATQGAIEVHPIDWMEHTSTERSP
jgi:hypothetical protein